MSMKLTYFNVIGFGEAIRYLLHYTGQKFEDIRIEVNSWPIKAIKEALPYGRMPLFEEDGRTLNQSVAIAKYVASKAGPGKLVPTDPWEQAVAEAAVLTIYDFFNIIITDVIHVDDLQKREGNIKKIIAEDLPFFFSRFEKELQANNGHFVGKLSWADFILVTIMEDTRLYLNVEVEKPYPNISALFKKIQGLPGVKEYIAQRPVYTAD